MDLHLLPLLLLLLLLHRAFALAVGLGLALALAAALARQYFSKQASVHESGEEPEPATCQLLIEVHLAAVRKKSTCRDAKNIDKTSTSPNSNRT